MQRLYAFLTLSILGLAILSGCQKDAPALTLRTPELPAQLANYSDPEVSDGFWINASQYEVTDAGATLGRVLFYDRILSKDNTVSCGSCHLQEQAFADPVALSTGINGQKLSRHTPGISNVYDDPFLFWDGRAKSVEDLVLKPVRNHKEMGLDDMEFLVAKIKKAPYYADLFEQAFGPNSINQENIADALAQFLSSMISGNSKYDEVMAGHEEFSPLEEEGNNLFFGEGRCYQCHSGLDFNTRGGFTIDIDPFFPFGGWGDPSANIGLDKVYTDQGMGEFDPRREGVFKIPSLRNVALTAPYMHDGRFATLEDCISHYSDNIADHENLAFELQDWNLGGPMRLHFTDAQKGALVAFLKTLTDERFINDDKFSDPFQY